MRPLEAGERVDGATVTVAGRIMLLRMLGKLTFATLQDASGRIQVWRWNGDGWRPGM